MIVTARGLGASTGSTIVGATGGAAGATIGALSASPAVLSFLGLSAAAGPIGIAVGALVAAGAAIASALGLGAGCGQTCIEATNVVNQAEPVFVQNVEQYETGQIDQTTAIANYQQMQTAVEQSCGAISGAAGTNCISDRFTPGGCKWKATSQPYPSSPPVGSCWNWYSGYYLPLTQPSVTPYASTSTSASSIVGDVTDTISSLSDSGGGLLLVGGLALLGIIMVSGD